MWPWPGQQAVPDEGLEDGPQDFDEAGGVHHVEGLQVLLVPEGGDRPQTRRMATPEPKDAHSRHSQVKDVNPNSERVPPGSQDPPPAQAWAAPGGGVTGAHTEAGAGRI